MKRRLWSIGACVITAMVTSGCSSDSAAVTDASVSEPIAVAASTIDDINAALLADDWEALFAELSPASVEAGMTQAVLENTIATGIDLDRFRKAVGSPAETEPAMEISRIESNPEALNPPYEGREIWSIQMRYRGAEPGSDYFVMYVLDHFEDDWSLVLALGSDEEFAISPF